MDCAQNENSGIIVWYTIIGSNVKPQKSQDHLLLAQAKDIFSTRLIAFCKILHMPKNFCRTFNGILQVSQRSYSDELFE